MCFVFLFVCFIFPTTAPQDTFSLLKPSTLKQLGRTVPSTTAKQVSTCREVSDSQQRGKSTVHWSFVCCCLCRTQPWQRTEGRLRLLWPTGKSISWRSCPSSNNTPCQTSSVYDQQCCLLLCIVAYWTLIQSHLPPDFRSLWLFFFTGLGIVYRARKGSL